MRDTQLAGNARDNQAQHPLGLLLELIRQRQTELSSISLAEITTAYLHEIRQLSDQNPTQLGDFIELGAKLVYLKSVALLPLSEPEQTAEITELSDQLQRYQLLKDLAAALESRQGIVSLPRPAGSSCWQSTAPGKPAGASQPNAGAKALSQLAGAMVALMERQPAPLRHTGSAPPPISLHEATERLDKLLAQYPRLPLRELGRHTAGRPELIALFLAILEQLRHGKLQAVWRAAGPAAGPDAAASWELSYV